MVFVGSLKILYKMLYPPPTHNAWKEGNDMAHKEFDLMTRKRITLKYAKVYRKATSKKEKSRILTEFVQLTGYRIGSLKIYTKWHSLRNGIRWLT